MDILQAIQALASAHASKQQEAISHCMAYFDSKKHLHHSQSPIIASLKQPEIKKALRVLNDVFITRKDEKQGKHLLDAAYFLLRNYSEANKVQACNDLSLMYMNMEAYYQLNFHQKPELARQVLEEAPNYNREKVECDPVLLALTINNLSCLSLKLGDYDLAFKHSFQLMEPLQIYFKKAKLQNHPRLKEEIVVLINTYYLVVCSMKACAEAYGSEMNSNLTRHYHEYTQNFLSKGHRLCLEYLGKKSIFTQFYRRLGSKDPTDISTFKPPLVVRIPKDNHNVGEAELKKELEEAVKKCIEPKLQELQNLLVHKSPEKDTTNAAVLYEAICKHDNNFMFISKLFESIRGRFGKVKLSLQKNSMTIHRAEIDQQTVFSIQKQPVAVMNAPFSVQYQTCTPFQFLKYFIVPYVNVNSSKLEFTLQMKSLVDELKVSFLGESSGVIVTHIHSSIFRICINSEKSGIFYITLQVGGYRNSQEVIDQHIDVEDVDPTSTTISTKPEGEDIEKMKLFVEGILNEKPTTKKGLISTKKLVDKDTFQGIVSDAVKRIDEFVTDLFLTKYEKKDVYNTDVFLFKYMVKKFGQPWASIHCIRHQNDFLEVTVHNTYETFGLDGKVQAKGVGIYPLTNMVSDFGVTFEDLKKKIERLELFQIILKIFTLKTYEAELTAEQKTLYKVNAIQLLPLLGRVFKRTYAPKRYYIPITACLISIAGDEPVGVKTTAYSIHDNIERGVFLTIDAKKWLKKQKPQVSPKVPIEKFNKLGRFKYKVEYPMNTDYYLADTLTKGGFELLIQQFVQYPDEENTYGMKTDSGLLKWSRLEVVLTFNKFKKKLEKLA